MQCLAGVAPGGEADEQMLWLPGITVPTINCSRSRGSGDVTNPGSEEHGPVRQAGEGVGCGGGGVPAAPLN